MEFIKSSKLNLLRNNEPWGVGGVAGAEESTAVAKESGDPVAKL